ncbi:MAG: ribonuclease P protein subunit [Candidatus Marsarchaeota archaeon]|nr:ribonuclease P protein subunit [Candidatus Marsarchaeota archaeon]MCL5094419.1 ribonuclease P protein subunit [Candidatus Marsarchaeota archaeon]
MYNNKNILLHEFINLRVKIINSSDIYQSGLEGIVIDETKNLLIINTKKGIEKIVKKISVFKFTDGKNTFIINGRDINYKPYERIEKCIKLIK